MKLRYYLTIAKLALIVVTPVLLLILPATFFDNGESICLSKLLAGVECPACGLTRGCMHLIHLDWEEAYAYNMMSFIALPLVGIVWIKWGIKEWKIFKKLHEKLKTAAPAAIAGIADNA
jgi:hypothetical protein